MVALSASVPNKGFLFLALWGAVVSSWRRRRGLNMHLHWSVLWLISPPCLLFVKEIIWWWWCCCTCCPPVIFHSLPLCLLTRSPVLPAAIHLQSSQYINLLSSTPSSVSALPGFCLPLWLFGVLLQWVTLHVNQFNRVCVPPVGIPESPPSPQRLITWPY